MKTHPWFLLAVLALFFGACSLVETSPPPPAPAANWKTLSGQVRYRDAQRTLVADVVLRVSPQPDNYSMEVTKAGASLLKLDRADTRGWSRGFLGGRSFTGLVARAPANLQSWFQATDAAIHQQKNPSAASEIKIDFRLQP